MKWLDQLIDAIGEGRAPTQVEIEFMSTKDLRRLAETQGRTEAAAMARKELEFRRIVEREVAVTINVRHGLDRTR